MSAIASAHADGVPLVTLGGRAPEMRWGMGSPRRSITFPSSCRWSSRA